MCGAGERWLVPRFLTSLKELGLPLRPGMADLDGPILDKIRIQWETALLLPSGNLSIESY